MKRLIVGLCLTFMVSSFPILGMTRYSVVQAETKEKSLDSSCVEGKVLSDVNVRTGAGSKYKKVVIDGEVIILTKGQLVTIVEDPNKKNQSWYKVKIMVDGKEIIGYSSSKYIKKTGNVITPSPMPTKAPTPVPTKVPTPVPTTDIKLESSNDEGKDIPLKEESEMIKENYHTDQKDSELVWCICVIVVLMVGVGGSFYYYNKKVKQRSRRMDELAAEIAEKTKKELSCKRLTDNNNTKSKEAQQKSVATAIGEEDEAQHSAPSLDIRVIKGDQLISRDELIHANRDVYVKKKQQDMRTTQMELAATLAMDQQDLSNDSGNKVKYKSMSLQEKEQYRNRLNELKQHDKIIHKFFGEGEVYDNSDVKLIEIRFGQDSRFFNKDNLAVNRLLTIVEQQ